MNKQFGNRTGITDFLHDGRLVSQGFVGEDVLHTPACFSEQWEH
jgi:hypothetical protein